MARVSKTEVCPICGQSAKVREVWTKNKYGKRYSYKIYNHGTQKHYVNENKLRRTTRKGEILDDVTALINSEQFRLSLFSLSDIREELKKKGKSYNDISIRNSLINLKNNGLITTVRKGRNLFFMNNMNETVHNFTFIKTELSLVDSIGDGMMRDHKFVVTLRNNKNFSLNYIPFEITGDTARTMEELKFHAIDRTAQIEIRPMILIDQPRLKRMLIRFPQPVLPGDFKSIEINYSWEEIKPYFTFGSIGEMEDVIFEIKSLGPNSLKATYISSDRTNNIDISDRVQTSRDGDFYVSRIVIDQMSQSSVLFLEWKIKKK